MKVILNEDIANLGEEGDIKDLAPGYVRNFLLPRKKVLLPNKQNINNLKLKANILAKKKEEKNKQALSIKSRLEAEEFEIKMLVGDNGHLFGAVTNVMLANLLAEHGINVERRKIQIPNHTLKEVGVYTLSVKLYNEEQATMKIRVSGVNNEGLPVETKSETQTEESDESELENPKTEIPAGEKE